MRKLTVFLAVMALLFVPAFVFAQDAAQTDGQQDEQTGTEEGGLGSGAEASDSEDGPVTQEDQFDQPLEEAREQGEAPADVLSQEDMPGGFADQQGGVVGQEEVETDEAEDEVLGAEAEVEVETPVVEGEVEAPEADMEAEGELGVEEPMVEGEAQVGTDTLGVEQDQIFINSLIGMQVVGENGEVIGTIQDVQTDAFGNVTQVTIQQY